MGSLLVIIGGLIAGKALGAILAGFTAAEWLTLAEGAVQGGGLVIEGLSSLHPLFAAMEEDLKKGFSYLAAKKAHASATAGEGVDWAARYNHLGMGM